MACDARHRRAMRSWPKTLGNRLYGSLSTRFGITASILESTEAEYIGFADTDTMRYAAGAKVPERRPAACLGSDLRR